MDEGLTDAKLLQMVNSVAMEGYLISDPLILPMSVQNFYDNFIKDGAPYSLYVFNSEVQKGHRDIKVGALVCASEN